MKKTKEQFITVILEAGNGFSKRMKLPKEDLTPRIIIPFMYRLRISDPVASDYFDTGLSVQGQFLLQRRTKTMAFYKLANLFQPKQI